LVIGKQLDTGVSTSRTSKPDQRLNTYHYDCFDIVDVIILRPNQLLYYRPVE